MNERPTYLPQLPPLYQRTDFLPSDMGQVAAPAPTEIPAPASTDPTGVVSPAEQREQERITLAGRLGSDVHFKTTPKGTLVARFPLAVHHDDRSTTWHTVLLFGDRAEALRGKLTKGQHAEVIGYTHTREATGRDGKTKTIEEIYAVAVKGR